MRRTTISEDARADLQAGMTAHRAAVTVCNALASGLMPEQHVQMKPFGKCFLYPATKCGLADMPHLAILITTHRGDEKALTGTAYDWQAAPVLGYTQCIAIHALSEIDASAIAQAVGNTRFLFVFEHEFIHVLDDARTAGRIGDNYSVKTNKVYFNHPAEFNAFYHGIASTLSSLADAIRDDPASADDLMDLHGLDGNFAHDLTTLLRPHHLAAANFLRNLEPKRRRSMVRRLYALHGEVFALAGHAQGAEATAAMA